MMVNHEDIQDRLREVISAVVGRDRLPTIHDREKLDLMEAAILEVLRFQSHVPLCLPHYTTDDTLISDFFIPKNTKVNLEAAHWVVVLLLPIE